MEIYHAVSTVKDSNIKVIKHLNNDEYGKIHEIINNINNFKKVYMATDDLISYLSKINTIIDEFDSGINYNLFVFNIKQAITGFLTAVRSYVDTFSHTLSSYYGKESNVYNTFEKEKRNAHSQNESYKFIEEVRNYTQHRAFPECNLVTKSIDGKNHKLIMLSKHVLLKDKKFRSNRIPTEYVDKDDIDIVKHFIIMFGCLAMIHNIVINEVFATTNFDEYFNLKEKYHEYVDHLCLTTFTSINEKESILSIASFDFNVIEASLDSIKQSNEYLAKQKSCGAY